MSDEPLPPTLPPALRISATYPATDGSCPEQVTVEVPLVALDSGLAILAIDDVLIDHVVKTLADVPSRARSNLMFRPAWPTPAPPAGVLITTNAETP